MCQFFVIENVLSRDWRPGGWRAGLRDAQPLGCFRPTLTTTAAGTGLGVMAAEAGVEEFSAVATCLYDHDCDYADLKNQHITKIRHARENKCFDEFRKKR